MREDGKIDYVEFPSTDTGPLKAANVSATRWPAY